MTADSVKQNFLLITGKPYHTVSVASGGVGSFRRARSGRAIRVPVRYHVTAKRVDLLAAQ